MQFSKIKCWDKLINRLELTFGGGSVVSRAATSWLLKCIINLVGSSISREETPENHVTACGNVTGRGKDTSEKSA